eukprot:TRINITY_DN1008_c0_g1_i1.p1 TRINITY_DN1008_c0_g1~~TRINITY_DN1008_c0_g1_i1.p1  ORF type:complete len:168 (+),score=40.66 TRINITY_DN1008_c0_g1_i1:66-506(+)
MICKFAVVILLAAAPVLALSDPDEMKIRIKVVDASVNETAGSTAEFAIHLKKLGEPSWYLTTLSGLKAGELWTFPVQGSPYTFAEIESAILIAFASDTDNLMVEGVWLQHVESNFWRKLFVHGSKNLVCCGAEMIETWRSTCPLPI